MSGDQSIILVLLAVLMAKHCVFDFVLQTPYQFRNKGTYGHPGGILHAGLHAFGSIVAIVILPPAFLVAVAIVVGEFIIHYHIDWTKEQLERRFKLTPADAQHYYLLGVDQLAHQLTYIGITAVLVTA